MRRMISLAIVIVTVFLILTGCGGSHKETKPDGTSAIQSKKAIVAYNSVGYGDEWLEALADEFNKMYANEGYEIELKISPNMVYQYNAALEIGIGPDKNDIDMYVDAYNLEGLLEASNKTMRGQGAVLVDMRESVWNKPAIGLNKQEESKTVAERFFLDEKYVYYNGKNEEYHGGVYVLPTGMELWTVGINVNPSVIEKYGYTVDNLPKTTDEFNQMCETIAAKTNETDIYAYAWAGGNCSGYLAYLFFEYFAQYTGYENFMNFCETKPFTDATLEDIKQDGWRVYENPGILEAFKAMEPMMEMRFSPNGSSSMDHMKAQHILLTGQAAFMISGDWLLYQMKDEYYEEASQCIMMKTPVLSVIGSECGITDAELSTAVDMIDKGKTDEEIMAEIPGLDQAETTRIRDARNIYCGGETNIRSGCVIPAYADGRDVAILFARFMCSEDALRIIRNHGYKINCYECDSYDFEVETPYMQSVLSNINPGEGRYVAMDSSLSIVRSNSGMLYFNHPANVQPVTFKNMILDTTGEMTAQRMYDNEIAYVKENWSTWVAYLKD